MIGLERRQPAGEPLEGGVLLRLQPRQPLGDLRRGRGRRRRRCRRLGPVRRERRLRRALGVAQRLEPRLEPGERLAGRLAFEPGEPRLDRREPPEHRLRRRVLLRVQPRQLLEQRRLRRAVVAARRRCRPGALQRPEPLAEPLEEAARLGGVADLLEHAHAVAQLVEPGKRGLDRGVLVADEPEELPGGRLQPLLRAAGALEPPREVGLAALERREAQLQPVRRLGLGKSRRRPAGRPRDPPPPLPRRPAPGEHEERDRPGHDPEGADDSE